MGKVQSNSREIASLRQPQKKPHHVHLMHGVHEACQHRDHSPANQDSRDPNPRTDLVHQQIAGNFKEELSKKENAGDQSVLLAGYGQFPVHRERSKPNVDAIEQGNNKKHQNKGNKPHPQLANGSGFEGHFTNASLVQCGHSRQSAASEQRGHFMALKM
jgi:hypothetical protein